MWIPTNDYLESHRQLLCKLVLIDKFSFSSKGSLNSQHFLRFSPWSGNHRLVLITCHRPTPTAQFSKTMRKKRFTQNTSETRFSKRRGKHKNYRSPVCNLCFFFIHAEWETFWHDSAGCSMVKLRWKIASPTPFHGKRFSSCWPMLGSSTEKTFLTHNRDVMTKRDINIM